MKTLPVAVIVLLLLLYPILLLVFSSTPAVKVEPPVKVVGFQTPVHAEILNRHGVRRITAYLEQNGNRYPVYEVKDAARRWSLFRNEEPARKVSFEAGKKEAKDIQNGKGHLIIEAVSNDLRGSTTTESSDIEVNLRPPALAVDGLQHYINQGGSELVTFTPSGYWTEAGVRVGKYTFRSFPLPGKPEERFCLFAFPWDVSADATPTVYVRNPSGAEVTAKFWTRIFPKPPRKRDLDITDAFLERVVPPIDHQSSGAMLERFLKINGAVRRENNKVLADLRLKTAEKVLWSGPFIQQGNSKVESQFADQRSYIYKGKKVDEQMHLGFDLSVTKNNPVQAGNSGVVLWAAELGIYGNCVVIDHGFGLQSIYGHMSSLDVKPGDPVKKGQVIGKSGATGLAGGDHLHYSMQVDGVQVNPVEWWDAHWIKDRIATKLALP